MLCIIGDSYYTLKKLQLHSLQNKNTHKDDKGAFSKSACFGSAKSLRIVFLDISDDPQTRGRISMSKTCNKKDLSITLTEIWP